MNQFQKITEHFCECGNKVKRPRQVCPTCKQKARNQRYADKAKEKQLEKRSEMPVIKQEEGNTGIWSSKSVKAEQARKTALNKLKAAQIEPVTSDKPVLIHEIELGNPKPERKKSISQLIRLADTWISREVRLEGTDEHGYGACVTCGLVFHYSILQNGHCFGRSHLKIRFNKNNLGCQCPECNVEKQGNQKKYFEYVIKERGQDVFDGLIELMQDKEKTTTKDLEQIIDESKKNCYKLAQTKMFSISWAA